MRVLCHHMCNDLPFVRRNTVDSGCKTVDIHPVCINTKGQTQFLQDGKRRCRHLGQSGQFGLVQCEDHFDSLKLSLLIVSTKARFDTGFRKVADGTISKLLFFFKCSCWFIHSWLHQNLRDLSSFSVSMTANSTAAPSKSSPQFSGCTAAATNLSKPHQTLALASFLLILHNLRCVLFFPSFFLSFSCVLYHPVYQHQVRFFSSLTCNS